MSILHFQGKDLIEIKEVYSLICNLAKARTRKMTNQLARVQFAVKLFQR